MEYERDKQCLLAWLLTCIEFRSTNQQLMCLLLDENNDVLYFIDPRAH